MRTFLFALLVFGCSYLSVGQHSLTVTFQGLESRDGNVLLALRDASGSDLEQRVVEIPSSGPIQYTFDDLPAGTYIVACYHDENENFELDKNFLGLPTELYGFSNDARGTMGPPDLVDQQFQLSANKSIVITLK